jgi:membrane protease YdiL (CAAX protease family)
MPTPLDIAFGIFYAVGIAGIAGLYFDRRLKRAIAGGRPNARLNAYRRATAVQWALAIITVVLWMNERRAWRVLGLVPPSDWRLVVGVAIVVVVVVLVTRQNSAVRRLETDKLQQLEKQIANIELILPHDEREYRWFMLLSCTAGVCEELLYRGFLTWLVAAYTGLPLAIIVVSVCFGAAHAYQGVKGVVKTGVVALVMSGIVLVSGWLVPAMIVHALVDVAGGAVGFVVIRRRPFGTPAAAT